MRTLACVALVAACGDNRAAPDAARHDAAQRDATVDASTACKPRHGIKLGVHRILRIDGALTATATPDGDTRLFVVAKAGTIGILAGNTLAPFLDLSPDAGGPVISLGDEQGLVGLAFDPAYATNRRFYVSYTTDSALVIARYTASSTDPDRADPTSATPIFTLALPTAIHHGGTLGFGADGRLYVGIGDGNVPAHAPDPASRFGKLVAIDLADNSTAVIVSGLRNPWRWSFDRPTGDLWIGDVGENTEEEIDVLPAGAQLGADLGWPRYEGTQCTTPPCDPTGLVAPTFTQTHANGWRAAIGGEVYRGHCFPDLVGRYVFGDLGTRQLLSGTRDPSTGALVTDLPAVLSFPPTSIAHGGTGELYLTGVDGTLAALIVLAN